LTGYLDEHGELEIGIEQSDLHRQTGAEDPVPAKSLRFFLKTA
jgi:hypothetical protein